MIGLLPGSATLCLVTFFFEILLDFQVYGGYISIRLKAMMMLDMAGRSKNEKWLEDGG